MNWNNQRKWVNNILAQALDGLIINEYTIQSGYGFTCLKLMMGQNSKLYLVANNYLEKYQDNVVEIYEVTYDLKPVLKDRLYLDSTYIIHFTDISVNKTGLVSILYNVYDKKEQDSKLLYRILSPTYQQMTQTFFEHETAVTFLQNNTFQTISYKEESTNKIYMITTHDLLNIFTLGEQIINKPSDKINQYQIKYNYEDIKYNQIKSKINYDPYNFGHYQQLYYFTTNIVDLVYYFDLEVKPLLSVTNNGIYDLNHQLNFNGKGYLNNELINNNTKINIAGKYTLEVKGIYNETIKVDFEVASLSTRIEETTNNIDISNIGITQLKNTSKDKLNIQCQLTENEKESKKVIWPILIPIICSVGSIWLFSRKRG